MTRAGLYARVSTADQQNENQLLALRSFAAARGWVAVEFQDVVSGAKEKRVGLDALMAAARARKIDVVIAVKLDRLARSVSHLVAMAGEFKVLGVQLVILDQQLDTTTAAGQLLFHVIGAIAEFERSLIVDRVRAGLARARAQGRQLGRPKRLLPLAKAQQLIDAGQSLRQVAAVLGVPASTMSSRLRALRVQKSRAAEA